MSDPTAPAIESEADAETAATAPHDLVDDELLIEDVSIDGMCGVY